MTNIEIIEVMQAATPPRRRPHGGGSRMNWHAINQHEFYAYDGQNRLGYVGYNATYGYWSWSVERTKECGTAGSKEDATKAVEAAVEPLGERR